MLGENFVGREEVLKILAKDPSAVTDAEREILRARRSYLTDEEKERYGIEETTSPEPKKKKSKE
jgi:hypothetical protein